MYEQREKKVHLHNFRSPLSVHTHSAVTRAICFIRIFHLFCWQHVVQRWLAFVDRALVDSFASACNTLGTHEFILPRNSKLCCRISRYVADSRTMCGARARVCAGCLFHAQALRGPNNAKLIMPSKSHLMSIISGHCEPIYLLPLHNFVATIFLLLPPSSGRGVTGDDPAASLSCALQCAVRTGGFLPMLTCSRRYNIIKSCSVIRFPQKQKSFAVQMRTPHEIGILVA